MAKYKELIYRKFPNLLQNALISLFDFIQYNKRHSGDYFEYKKYYETVRNLPVKELKTQQLKSLSNFLKFAKQNSPYYNEVLADIDVNHETIVDQYLRIPIQSKEDIRENLQKIHTIGKDQAVLSKTGGTTGKSMEVRFTYADMQNRFALLDFWRAGYGYKLGEKVAWFSGKTLLTSKDINRNRYWKYDFLYKKRFYSTFHINEQTIKYYIDDLNYFKPLFAVGFPSSMYEIAKWGLKNNYFLSYKMKTLFPTAETIVETEKEVIERFFGGRVVNQYASSEGAPFILECNKGKLHLELLSGYFEVLDSNGNPTKEGELVFTSFTTHGTPLIRYAIKDSITLSDEICDCGNNNPVVKAIQGRINDFIYSRERGKINLGNVSNSVKYVSGVIRFQIVQEREDCIDVYVVKSEEYTQKDEKLFRDELVQRLGNKVEISFHYVEDIPKEPSGKYRIVKQSLIIP